MKIYTYNRISNKLIGKLDNSSETLYNKIFAFFIPLFVILVIYWYEFNIQLNNLILFSLFFFHQFAIHKTNTLKNRNLSALANYKGYLDPAFLASINSFWLEFPPTSPTAHYTLAIIYAIMMFVGITGNALVIYMFAR